MCLIVIGVGLRLDLPLVVVAHRDEFHDRPTRPAHWWPGERHVAGQDLEAGGTWFVAAPGGRFAAVTNIRRAEAEEPPGRRSRGELPLSALSVDPETAARQCIGATDYAGFNLLTGDPDRVWFAGNRGDGPTPLAAGVHALSNASLNTPWPKVRLARERLGAVLAARRAPDFVTLVRLLHDTRCPDDRDLPDTGVGLERERMLAPPFIATPTYGTRSVTVYLVDAARNATFIERRFNRLGLAVGETRIRLPADGR